MLEGFFLSQKPLIQGATFYTNLVSGPGDGNSRSELRCWGVVSGFVSLEIKSPSPSAWLWPSVAMADLPAQNLVPCPAQPDLQRGQRGFIKCLSLDRIWDNTVLLCLAGPWLQQGPCVCQASTSVPPVPPLSLAGHRGTPGLTFLGDSAGGSGRAQRQQQSQYCCCCLSPPWGPQWHQCMQSDTFVTLHHPKYSVFISNAFLSLNSSFPTSMLCMPSWAWVCQRVRTNGSIKMV